jgi:hypothetical protein
MAYCAMKAALTSDNGVDFTVKWEVFFLCILNHHEYVHPSHDYHDHAVLHYIAPAQRGSGHF